MTRNANASFTRPVSRRAFLKTAGVGATLAALSACAAPVAAPMEDSGGEDTMAEPQELNLIYWADSNDFFQGVID
jgi:anaerobic selenocysteine-containing dehydrogenase